MLSSLLILPGQIKGYYKVQNQGALGNYIYQKMVSKLPTRYKFKKE